LVKDFDASLHVLNTGKRTEFNPDVVFESGLLQEMISDQIPSIISSPTMILIRVYSISWKKNMITWLFSLKGGGCWSGSFIKVIPAICIA
jgi:hypothetical protein